jgi:hypothetical protein
VLATREERTVAEAELVQAVLHLVGG